MSDGTVRSERGMVATSHPLATAAGARVLADGGSAADAAVCAAAVLNVVDPRSTGVGGDAFALWWGAGDHAPSALAGNGPAPAGLTLDAVLTAGYATMPEGGPWSIVVPGSVSLWERLLERRGRLDPARVLGPAIDLAREGFAVTPIVAEEWASGADRLTGAARAVFLPGGRPAASGERFANPDLGATLASIVDGGAAAFYEGAAADALAAAVEAAGGPLRAEDLAAYEGARWVEPLSVRFRDFDVYELPPPGQGLVALQALALYEGLRASAANDERTGFAGGGARDDRARGADEHALIEAIKLSFADAARYVADPAHMTVTPEALLSEPYLRGRRALIDPDAAGDARPGRPSDTVYVAVAAPDGACSLIQSLYEGFGSGIAGAGTGVLLQNRGSNFVLDPEHPNCVGPGKRPYHTIMPAMLGRGGELAGCLGVVGGFMQPQGQVQILRALVERGLQPQAALDAPRWRVQGGRRVDLEPGFPPAMLDELAARGHELGVLGRTSAGGAQLVLREPDGFAGASDRRKDGCAAGP